MDRNRIFAVVIWALSTIPVIILAVAWKNWTGAVLLTVISIAALFIGVIRLNKK